MLGATPHAVALNRDALGPPPVEAIRYWRGKGLRPGFDYRDVWEAEHDVAFTAAKIMREDVLRALRTSLDRAFAEGQTFASWRRSVRPELERMGFWGAQTIVDPETGREVETDVPSRLARIFETNMRTAHAAGQWERIQRTKASHPYLLYEIGASKEHRAEHVAWHGLCLRVEDPWWEAHFPPNGWGCKCHVRQISEREFERLKRDGIGGADKTPVLDPETSLPTGHVTRSRIAIRTEAPPLELVPWKNARTGETQLVPSGIDPGFAHRPSVRINEEPPPPSGMAPASEPTPGLIKPEPTPGSAEATIPPRVRAAGQVEVHTTHETALGDLERAMALSPAKRGAAVREASRRLFQTLHPTTRSFDLFEEREQANRLGVRSDLIRKRRARGMHWTNGLVEYDTTVFDAAREGLATIRGGGAPTDAQRQGLRTILHETAHEHSPAARPAWTDEGQGLVIEEVTTELLARDGMRQLGLYSDADVATVGSYPKLISRLVRVVQSHVPGASTWSEQDAIEHLVRAAVEVRDRASAIPTRQAYVGELASALGVSPEHLTAFAADIGVM